jgi:quercetin dioxygenase-like cupin family protein
VARAGDVLENPITGQRLIFRKTGRDTGGELLEVESVYERPSPSRLPEHYHPHQEERFEVLSGTVHVLIDGVERSLSAGEVIVNPPSTPHEMWSGEAGEARVNWQTRPSLNTETFFETL